MSETPNKGFEIRVTINTGDPIYDELVSLPSKARNRRALAILNRHAMEKTDPDRALLPSPAEISTTPSPASTSVVNTSDRTGVTPVVKPKHSEQPIMDEPAGSGSLLDDLQTVV